MKTPSASNSPPRGSEAGAVKVETKKENSPAAPNTVHSKGLRCRGGVCSAMASMDCGVGRGTYPSPWVQPTTCAIPRAPGEGCSPGWGTTAADLKSEAPDFLDHCAREEHCCQRSKVQEAAQRLPPDIYQLLQISRNWVRGSCRQMDCRFQHMCRQSSPC